ncbi:MAG TPA: glycosyltransferase family 4 protein [Azospirillaceae bacterium]|nr:glycosyltransferase family 4 protein [Azospirillaceae bacterium]
MRPPRVVMIIQYYVPMLAGAERQLATVAPRLARAGLDVHVITRHAPGLAPFEMIDGVSVHRLASRGPKAAVSLGFTALAQPLIRRLRPDVVHAHELLSPTTTALVAKAMLGMPVVAKVLRGGLLGDIDKLRGDRLGRLRLAAISRWVDAFAVISREIDEELAAIGVPPDRRVFLPNGVDVQHHKPLDPDAKRALRASLGLPADAPVALFVGRFEEEKRPVALAELWPAVRAAVPGAELVMVGRGALAEALGDSAGPGVRLVGYHKDVTPYYQSADVFVLPSATEGLSNALLEAMASGLACVATAVGGAPDLIRPGLSGHLVTPGDERGLRAALVDALTAVGSAEMGRAARHKVVTGYSLDATVEKLIELYSRFSPAVDVRRPNTATTPAHRAR